MNAGRRALLRVLQIIRAREVAARTRVSPSEVSRWASGERMPSDRARAALEAHCQIRAELWSVNTPTVTAGKTRT